MFFRSSLITRRHGEDDRTCLPSLMCRLAITLAATVSLASAANAASLPPPPAVFGKTLEPFGAGSQQFFFTPGTFAVKSPPDPGFPGAVREVRTTVTALPEPSIKNHLLVTANYEFFPNQGTSVASSIIYYVRVNGPILGILTPLDMNLSWSVFAEADTA